MLTGTLLSAMLMVGCNGDQEPPPEDNNDVIDNNGENGNNSNNGNNDLNGDTEPENDMAPGVDEDNNAPDLDNPVEDAKEIEEEISDRNNEDQ